MQKSCPIYKNLKFVKSVEFRRHYDGRLYIHSLILTLFQIFSKKSSNLQTNTRNLENSRSKKIACNCFCIKQYNCYEIYTPLSHAMYPNWSLQLRDVLAKCNFGWIFWFVHRLVLWVPPFFEFPHIVYSIKIRNFDCYGTNARDISFFLSLWVLLHSFLILNTFFFWLVDCNVSNRTVQIC